MARTCALPSLRFIQRHLSAHPRATLAASLQAAVHHVPSRSIHQTRALLFEFDDAESKSQGEDQQPEIDQPEQDYPRRVEVDFAKLKENLYFPEACKSKNFVQGNTVSVSGFLSQRRLQGSKLIFADIETPGDFKVQVVAKGNEEGDDDLKLLDDLKKMPLHSAVSVTGLAEKVEWREDYFKNKRLKAVEIQLQKIQVLNAFPKDISMARDKQFPNDSRHLQIRTSTRLRNRLKVRAFVAHSMRKTLAESNVTEYETPLLFKSTSEGAREFLVASRRRGHAYALPQSPQQFKQILMASGIPAYYQFARCFRDEDLRADRQPEFTQLDLELAFASRDDVIDLVEKLLFNTAVDLRPRWGLHDNAPVYLPKMEDAEETRLYKFRKFRRPFQRMTYQKAMEKYGTDKPDLRIPWKIRRVNYALHEGFVRMITKLKNPCVEAFVFRPKKDTCEVEGSSGIHVEIRRFMDELPRELRENPDGKPAILRYDSGRPLNGLAALGHEGAERIVPLLKLGSDLEDGDYIFFQAREDKAFRGEGSTALGQLRTLLFSAVTARGLMPLPQSGDFRFLWVTDFPLFTPTAAGEPGQGGGEGLRATHHPFTAPLGPDDLEEVLLGDPLLARADHFDLVANGVELGGGSRRIHVSTLQEHVLRNVLGMPPDDLAQFEHLLRALHAGCPPHAGFALGFDRFVALLTAAPSMRNVIAFPKTAKGKDPMTQSPGPVRPEQWWPYHLMPTHVDREGKKSPVPYRDFPAELLEKSRGETLGLPQDDTLGRPQDQVHEPEDGAQRQEEEQEEVELVEEKEDERDWEVPESAGLVPAENLRYPEAEAELPAAAPQPPKPVDPLAAFRRVGGN